MCSLFTRSEVQGVNADHVRGLTVHQLKHGQTSSVAGELEEKNYNVTME